MVHCIHNNQHNQNKKKETNYLEINELNEEMILLNTKDVDENSTIESNNSNILRTSAAVENSVNQNDKQTTTDVKTVGETKQTTTAQQSQFDQENELKSKSLSVLSYEQVKRLDEVIEQTVPIHGRGNFPTLNIKLKKLVNIVRSKLENEQSIRINDIRLNGGAASHVLLTAEKNSTYNDLDLIFAVDLSDHKTYDKIRTAVLDSLLEFLPEGANRNRISLTSLKDAYIHKMVGFCLLLLFFFLFPVCLNYFLGN